MIIMKLLCDACSCAGGALEFGPARRGAILKHAPRRAGGNKRCTVPHRLSRAAMPTPDSGDVSPKL